MDKPTLDRIKITPISRRTRQSLTNPDNGELVEIYDAEDKETGAKGRYRLEYEWEKRDVLVERLYTDNPELILDDFSDGPSVYDWFGAGKPDFGPDPGGLNEFDYEAWGFNG